MSMTYENMMVQALHAGLVCDSFIKGIEPYRYEDYLVELINKSEFFLAKSGGEQYCRPASEAHGECDCVSNQYQMDFKRIASKTQLQSKSLFSMQIVVVGGVTLYCAPKKQSNENDLKPFKATILHAALRPLLKEALVVLRQSNVKANGIENDIMHYLKNLDTDKNLFLFFPYNFFFEENDDFQVGLSLAIKGINEGFGESMKYRQEQHSSLDTFFAFIYSQNMIILSLEKDELVYKDMIPVCESPLFSKLLGYVDSLGLGILK